MTLTRSELRLSIILTVLFAVATWLYVHSQIDYQNHLGKLNTVVEIQNKAATLVEEVLLVENGAKNNFDAIAQIETDLEKLSIDVAFIHQSDALTASIKEILATTEQVKSTYSVYRNSAIYLFKGFSGLDQLLSDTKHAHLLNEIYQVVHQVLLYTAIGAPHADMEGLLQERESLQRISSQLPTQISSPVNKVLKHIVVMIDYSHKLSELNHRLLDNQTIGLCNQLISQYNAELEISTNKQTDVKKGFYLSIAGLILFSIWGWHKQQKALFKLSQNAQHLERASRVFNNTHEAIIITNSQGEIIDVNPAFCDITAYSRAEIIGQNPSILSSGKQDKSFYQNMWNTLLNEGYWQGEIWNRKKTGELYAQLQTISTIKDEKGIPVNYIGLFTDITHSKEQQDKLNFMAHYDVLTGLPNRVLFVDRFNQAIAHSNRAKTQLAVCFLDLDDFKPVNDNYGHEIGDKLLIEVAARIKRCIRDEDTLSRQGGDEFALLLNDILSVKDYEVTMDRIHHELAKPFLIGGHSHIVTVSSGMTLYPNDKGDIDTLLRHADHAMYEAKQTGRNRYELFDITQDQETIDMHQHLNEIKHSLDNNEFSLFYQPKVNMLTGKVVGVEALIRWLHPTKGLIPPLEFLPLIYGTEVEIGIGNWVIEQALRQLEQWQKQNIELKISINVASYQLQSGTFVEDLEQALSRYPEVDPQFLELEILESSKLSDLTFISNITGVIQNVLGVPVALDDFGTGYSSLTHLSHLSAKTLKIDQTFVQNMLDDPGDYAIIDGVISLANSFHRDIIAEGVETSEQGIMLINLGCELVQGYCVARPMSAADFQGWLQSYQPNQIWINFGKNYKTGLIDSSQLLNLTLDRWYTFFLSNIQSSSGDIKQWPILDETQCHCGIWVKHSENSEEVTIQPFSMVVDLHSELHRLANEIYSYHQSGRLIDAQTSLDKFHSIYRKIKNLLPRLNVEN